MSAFNFDATDVRPATGTSPVVPAGVYTAQMSSSEIKDTSAKNGRFIEANFKIVGGEFAGCIVKDRINVENVNEEAARIGRETLSAICHAVGVLKFTMTDQLHGRPLTITVDIEPYEKVDSKTGLKETKQSNRIKGYSKLEGSTPGATTSAPPAFVTQPPVAATPPPAFAQPAPVAPPVVAPTPPPQPATLYYVSHKGTNITPTPISAQEVLAKGLPANEVMVCANGGTTWESVSVLTPAPPSQPPTPAAPPWARA